MIEAAPRGNILLDRLAAAGTDGGVELLDWAGRQRLIGQLREIVAEGGQPHALSADVLGELRARGMALVAADLRRRADLTALLGAFHQAEIPVIPLKGAWLAYGVYRRSETRDMCDLDFLVPPEHVRTALDTIAALGWSVPLLGEDLAAVLQDAHETPPLYRPGHMFVDLHWAIEKPSFGAAIPMADLWARSAPVQILGQPCRQLSIEDCLLHLCLHAGVHHAFRVSAFTLFDIAALIGRQAPDWDVVDRRAREWGIRNAVQIMLALARRHADAPLPDELASNIEKKLGQLVDKAAWLLCDHFARTGYDWTPQSMWADLFSNGWRSFSELLWRRLVHRSAKDRMYYDRASLGTGVRRSKAANLTRNLQHYLSDLLRQPDARRAFAIEYRLRRLGRH